MIIVTVATHIDGYLNTLIESLKRYNISLNILGLGTKWKGFQTKIVLMRDYMETLNDDEIVVFIDAYDVIFLHPEDLEQKFKSFNKKIIFGEDLDIPFYHKYSYNKMFPPCILNKKKYRINTGLYMGYVKYIKELLNILCKENDCTLNLDDQRIVNISCNTDFFYKHVGVDSEHKIFYNLLLFGSTIKLTNNRLLVNDNKPNFVHGPNNRNMDYIIKAYDLPKSVDKKRSFYLLNVIKNYYMYFIPEIIILFLTILIIILIKKKYINKKKL